MKATIAGSKVELIDVRGGRVIMTLGSVLLSIGLVALSQVQGPSDRPSWLQTWLPAPPFAQ